MRVRGVLIDRSQGSVDFEPTPAGPACVLQMNYLRTIVDGHDRWVAVTADADGGTT